MTTHKDRLCPACRGVMFRDYWFSDSTGVESFYCKTFNHEFYTKLYRNELLTSKFILLENEDKIFLTINYISKSSHIYSKPNELHPIKLPYVLELNLADRDKVKLKLETILTFQ